MHVAYKCIFVVHLTVEASADAVSAAVVLLPRLLLYTVAVAVAGNVRWEILIELSMWMNGLPIQNISFI